VTKAIPNSHLDLVSDDSRPHCVLATIMADGSPQATPVWFDMDGEKFRLNTVRGRVKDKNIQARPQVALAIIDEMDPYRYLLVRGKVVAETEEGAVDHIFHLAEKYDGADEFTVPEGQVRVIYTVEPNSVVAG
jgi:PPOX class probable F420-dependent enzyme